MKPDVLLFGEPTSALNPMLVGEVLSVMRALADEGATIVIVTHEMVFAHQFADRIVFMEGGRVVEMAGPHKSFGSPDSLRARQFLARFHSHGGTAPKLKRRSVAVEPGLSDS
jgi:polar amino acid transport system ATP-binding protein